MHKLDRSHLLSIHVVFHRYEHADEQLKYAIARNVYRKWYNDMVSLRYEHLCVRLNGKEHENWRHNSCTLKIFTKYHHQINPWHLVSI